MDLYWYHLVASPDAKCTSSACHPPFCMKFPEIFWHYLFHFFWLKAHPIEWNSLKSLKIVVFILFLTRWNFLFFCDWKINRYKHALRLHKFQQMKRSNRKPAEGKYMSGRWRILLINVAHIDSLWKSQFSRNFCEHLWISRNVNGFLGSLGVAAALLMLTNTFSDKNIFFDLCSSTADQF